MKQQLERLLHSPNDLQKGDLERQRIYTLEDLESLSTIILYNDGENFVKKDGTIETVFPRFVGKDTLKIYINPFTGKIEAGYQKEGESHSDYADSGRTVTLHKGSNS